MNYLNQVTLVTSFSDRFLKLSPVMVPKFVTKLAEEADIKVDVFSYIIVDGFISVIYRHFKIIQKLETQ